MLERQQVVSRAKRKALGLAEKMNRFIFLAKPTAFRIVPQHSAWLI